MSVPQIKTWKVLVGKTIEGPYTKADLERLISEKHLRRDDYAAEFIPGVSALDWKFLWQFAEFDRRRGGRSGSASGDFSGPGNERRNAAKRASLALSQTKAKAQAITEGIPKKLSKMLSDLPGPQAPSGRVIAIGQPLPTFPVERLPLGSWRERWYYSLAIVAILALAFILVQKVPGLAFLESVSAAPQATAFKVPNKRIKHSPMAKRGKLSKTQLGSASGRRVEKTLDTREPGEAGDFDARFPALVYPEPGLGRNPSASVRPELR